MKIEISKKALMLALAFLGIAALVASFIAVRSTQGLQAALVEAQAKEEPVLALQELATLKENPWLKVSPDVLNLGTVKKSEGIKEGTFTLTNESQNPLEIKYAFASCGCSAADLKRQTLQPGGSVQMKVSYDPNYFEAELGKVQKRFTVFSNDPVNPFKKVYLQANVVP